MTENNAANDHVTQNTENIAEEGAQRSGEVRDNLREAGDALLAAGSALGAALGKFAEGVPERLKSATDSARETLNSANSEGEVRSWAANVTNEAEKAFNSFRERDVKFTEDAKETLRSSVADVRASFNERLDKLDSNSETEGGVIDDLRGRFESLVDRLQNQFAGEDAKAGKDAERPADTSRVVDGEVIDGEVVE